MGGLRELRISGRCSWSKKEFLAIASHLTALEVLSLDSLNPPASEGAPHAVVTEILPYFSSLRYFSIYSQRVPRGEKLRILEVCGTHPNLLSLRICNGRSKVRWVRDHAREQCEIKS